MKGCDDMTQFGTTLRDARKKKQLVLREVCELVNEGLGIDQPTRDTPGLSPSYLSKMETGTERNPGWRTIVQLVSVLGVPIVRLWAGAVSDNGKGEVK